MTTTGWFSLQQPRLYTGTGPGVTVTRTLQLLLCHSGYCCCYTCCELHETLLLKEILLWVVVEVPCSNQ